MSYPLVIANWKMNIPSGGVSGWIQNEMISNNDEVGFENKSSYLRFMGIAPPISHLTELKNLFNFGFLGAQDISKYNDGAKTGDISADMVIEKGCSFSILGHSERRTFFNETDEILKEKVDRALNENMEIIFCVGEQLSDRKSGNHFDHIKSQLEKAVFN